MKFESEIFKTISDYEAPSAPSNSPENTADLSEFSYKDFITDLKDLRCKNFRNIIFAQININSIHNKFGLLRESVAENVDILLISETKNR